jgi:hypothetical protein
MWGLTNFSHPPTKYLLSPPHPKLSFLPLNLSFGKKNSALFRFEFFFLKNFLYRDKMSGCVSLLHYSIKTSLKEACIFPCSSGLKSTLKDWQTLFTLFEAWLFALVGCRFVNIRTLWGSDIRLYRKIFSEISPGKNQKIRYEMSLTNNVLQVLYLLHGYFLNIILNYT